MAYVNEKNALHKLTSVVHNATTILGVVGGGLRVMVQRAMRAADGRNTPFSRPLFMLDSQAFVRTINPGGTISWTTAAANLTFNFSDGQGGTPSIVVGTMLGGDIDHGFDFEVGGMVTQQTFDFEGASLTYTVNI